MKERLFRFKHFSVSHSRSAMPIGVDGVLIGAWASEGKRHILDVGTGCGVIALMAAQRNPSGYILAIDIHAGSVEEAQENFAASPWRDRLEARLLSYDSPELSERKFDLVVSNPPFFDSGVRDLNSSRLKARHQGDLSPASLVRQARSILTDDGRLAMIFPASMYESVREHAVAEALVPLRTCFVRDHEGAPVKRVMAEFTPADASSLCRNGVPDYGEIISYLTMFADSQTPTDEYRELCRDFYLKF